MRLPRVQLTVRWLLVVVAILAGLAWAARMARRVFHYRAQAVSQARLEAAHRLEEQRLRTVGKGGFGAREFAEYEAAEADHHGRLKQQYQRLATHPWEDAPPGLPLPYPWDRGRDRAVLDAALADLMDPKNPENGIDFRMASGRPCPEIVVGEPTYPYLTHLPSDAEDATWSDLIRRNSGGPILLTGIGLGGNKRVRYDDPDRLSDASMNAGMSFPDYFQKRYPLACGYVWVTLPGYSSDGRKAAVFLFGGFNPHGQYWEYEMDRTDQGWEVRKRRHHQGG